MVQIASAIQNCYLGKPRIASVSTPTQPRLSESFRTYPSKNSFSSNRSHFALTLFFVLFATFCKRKVHSSLRLSAAICGYLRFRFMHDSVRP